MSLFQGAATALVTPFKDGKPDLEALSRLIEFQLSNGIDALVSCGTTGEASTLSLEEQIQIVQFTIDKVHHRVPVIAGAGSNDTQVALTKAKAMEYAGADGILMVTPYYNKCSQKGLIQHYTYIADRLKSPVILFRLAFLFLASLWGLPGYLAGLFALMLHLSSLKSFTIPYTSALSYSRRAMLQDTFLRAPWFRMIYRPDALAKNNHRRQLRCIFLLLLPLLLTGCTSSREINDVALISGITVEVRENEWFVHAQIPEISKDEENLKVMSGQGTTFEKAMKNLYELANEELYLQHSKSVALTGDLVVHSCHKWSRIFWITGSCASLPTWFPFGILPQIRSIISGFRTFF